VEFFHPLFVSGEACYVQTDREGGTDERKSMLFLKRMTGRCVFCGVLMLLLPGYALPVDHTPLLEEKIGQLLMVGFRGEEVDAASPVVRDIRRFHLGGVILFDTDVALGKPRRNIRSPEQLARLTAVLQSCTPETLLIAVDQEGGNVNRLKAEYGFPETVSALQMGKHDDPEYTYRESLRLAGALKAAGINLNLAPDVDLAVNPGNFIVQKERTFSADPGVTVRQAAQVIRAHHDLGILCTLKHFPGHGSSAADSHLGMVDVTDTWQPQELDPYRALCAQADVVMTAHIFLRSLDPLRPATLSRKIITGLLRNEIGYKGVVMSDDLGMNAIAEEYGVETALEQTLNAGVDLILIANNADYDPDIVPRTVRIVTELVESGRVNESRIDEAYRRVTRMKEKIRH
jgi:beta-N-acetylhexosaminidase